MSLYQTISPNRPFLIIDVTQNNRSNRLMIDCINVLLLKKDIHIHWTQKRAMAKQRKHISLTACYLHHASLRRTGKSIYQPFVEAAMNLKFTAPTQGNLSFSTESLGLCLVDSVGNNTTLLLVLGFWEHSLFILAGQGLSECETMVHMSYIFLLADTLLNHLQKTGSRVSSYTHLKYFYAKLRRNSIVLLNWSFPIW